MLTNFQDVYNFHRRFNLPIACRPSILAPDVSNFRIRRLDEEVREFETAVKGGDLEGAADALVDLVYIAMGTAIMMNLPWQAIWDEVQRANMTKVRATKPEDSKHGTTLDIIKPVGWVPPQHWYALGQPCPTCQAYGFLPSRKADRQCTFCDGTFNGDVE